MWGKSSESAASTDVRASSRPRKGVEGYVCPALIEGTGMVVATGKWGTLITQVRSAGELEIIRSLPGGPISVYLLEAITPPELMGGLCK